MLGQQPRKDLPDGGRLPRDGAVVADVDVDAAPRLLLGNAGDIGKVEIALIGAVYFGRRGAQRDPLDGRIGIAGALHRVAQVVDRSDAERSELLQPARRDIAQARASEYPAAPDTAAIRRAVAAEVAQIVKAFKVNAIHISS